MTAPVVLLAIVSGFASLYSVWAAFELAVCHFTRTTRGMIRWPVLIFAGVALYSLTELWGAFASPGRQANCDVSQLAIVGAAIIYMIRHKVLL